MCERHIDHEAMRLAVSEANKTMQQGIGGPFGSAITKGGKIIAVASNTVLGDHDATAHAEVNAIRKAGEVLGTHDLSGCEIYATGYPCPMCLSAIIWANIKVVHYGCTPQEADDIGFRDDFMYEYLESEGRKEPGLVHIDQVGHDQCIKLFEQYQQEEKTVY